MSKRIVLMVGHGSTSAEAVSECLQLGGALAQRSGLTVQTCFLELVDPDMASGLSQAAREAGKGGEVIILPIFLGAAGHQKNDVAASIQWARSQFADVTFRSGAPLGLHAKLVTLLDLRLNEALAALPALPPEQSIVLLCGRGSSDPDSNSEVARTAYLLFQGRPYAAVEIAFQAVARPKLAEGVQRAARLGARRLIVSPYVLFTGAVESDIHTATRTAASELGLEWAGAMHLGVHPLLVDVAEQRLLEAVQGQSAMTCDICRYRLPMAGAEHLVGAPQETHHLHKHS